MNIFVYLKKKNVLLIVGLPMDISDEWRHFLVRCCGFSMMERLSCQTRGTNGPAQNRISEIYHVGIHKSQYQTKFNNSNHNL